MHIHKILKVQQDSSNELIITKDAKIYYKDRIQCNINQHQC